MIVVFVHGWKHTASVCDENVACFREVLTALYNAEQLRSSELNTQPRRVIGVYVGWRGLSITTAGLKELSFYSRKNTAHRVGEGQVIELITRLERMRDRVNNATQGSSRLVVIGHSFGAALTYAAISNILYERLINRHLDADSGDSEARVSGFGDLVILVNPAFEASLYSGIHEVANSRDDYLSIQPPVLMVISSETDQATQTWFPIGRFFSTQFMSTRGEEQKQALRTTVGNFEPYRTHYAEIYSMRDGLTKPLMLPDIVEVSESKSRDAGECQCRYLERVPILSEREVGRYANTNIAPQTENINQELIFGEVVVQRTNNDHHPYNPMWVVHASDEIITQHNGIYNSPFINMVRAIIREIELR